MESPSSVSFKSKRFLDTWVWVIGAFTHEVSWWHGTLPVLQGFFLFVLQTDRTGYLKLSRFVVPWSLYLYKKVSGLVEPISVGSLDRMCCSLEPDLHQDLWQSLLCWVTCVSDRALTVLTAIIAVSSSIPCSALGWETSLTIARGFCLMCASARACQCTPGRLQVGLGGFSGLNKPVILWSHRHDPRGAASVLFPAGSVVCIDCCCLGILCTGTDKGSQWCHLVLNGSNILLSVAFHVVHCKATVLLDT